MLEFSVTQVPLSGFNLVEASAGTGKTYAIETLFVRFLLERLPGTPFSEHSRKISEILVVTFTEAATSELKERVRRRLLQAINICEKWPQPSNADEALIEILRAHGRPEFAKQTLLEAVQDFDNASIFTIHGFCHRVLRDHAFLTRAPFEAELLRDTRPLVDNVVADFLSLYLLDMPVPAINDFHVNGLIPLGTALRSFANRVAHQRHLRLVKEPNPTLDLSPVNAFLEQKQRLKAVFDKDALLALIEAAPLNRNSYRKTSVPNWIEEVGEFLDGTEVAQVPKQLSRFTYTALEQYRNKGGANQAIPRHPMLDAFSAFCACHTQLNAALIQQRAQLLGALLKNVQQRIEQHKLEYNQLSFDDLLQRLDGALSEASGALAKVLRQRYPIALLDEFQDTDPVQLSIFEKIYRKSAHPCVFLIGDPKQAIYSFRGADLFTYLHAAQHVAEQRYTLGKNRRSDAPLVRAVNALFAGQRPFLSAALEYPAVSALPFETSPLSISPELPSAPFVFRLARGFEEVPGKLSQPSARQLPESVASEVLALLNSESTLNGKRLSPKDFAVLTRTNAEAFACQAALAELRIPSVVLGDRSVFEYDEARELQQVLGAVLEPGNASRVRTALSTEMLGGTAEQLLSLTDNDDTWETGLELFRDLNARWTSYGFVQMIRRLITKRQITERFMRLPDGERRMTNLLHLIELLHTEAKESHLGPAGVYSYLAAQRNRVYAQSDSEQIRLESDEDAVVLTTIHKSKGLEYPIVLCPSLASTRLEHGADKLFVQFHSDDGRAWLDLESDADSESRQRMQAETFAENLRLLYVALTRAKYRCIVWWGRFRNYENTALGYLLHRPEADAAAPATEVLMAHLASMKELQDEDLLLALNSLQAQCGSVAVCPLLPLRDDAVFQRESDAAATLSSRSADLRDLRLRRTTSFTALTVVSHAEGALPFDDARDHDLHTEFPASGVELTPQLAKAAEPTGLADFPGGATVGNCFHSLLEHADFCQPLPLPAAQAALAGHGLPTTLCAAMCDAFEHIRNTDLGEGISLALLPRAQRLDELEFLLPVTDGQSYFTPAQLANAFTRFPSAQLPTSYAAALRRLSFGEIQGFLKGFIDLVFEYQGRWYLVDYKTNTLGATYADYSVQALKANMAHSHYFLQYHLYVVALDRYLRWRLPGYSYATHFGGVCYLYLRGMHPELGNRFGVFREVPPYARIQALSELFQAMPGTAVSKMGGAQL